MKKKGFTLIELIVVIAIIGVLAAILVPAMLGYVRKSKITTANTTAKSVYNAFNTALVDLDSQDVKIASFRAHILIRGHRKHSRMQVTKLLLHRLLMTMLRRRPLRPDF